ncbi:hypothetical protein C2U55_14905 [Enterobacteriaceae bacterium ENNIH3]|nr:hypothetical protein C2U55_14905 [Enterobacteriaceae bacterium ENNIH3]AUV09639.1 hypothetical protein C2U52_26990 [Enterobacteriaceae bacterium ENNIH2]
MFGDMLYAGISIIEIDYWRFAKELEKMDTPNAKSALGLLHAVAGKFDKSFEVFESALESYDDPSIAHNYCFSIEKSGDIDLLRSKVYEYSDRYGSKRLTSMAYNFAYQFGQRDELVKYIDQHIKLLSEDEGRSLAEKHKTELLAELDLAYRNSGCTEQQFQTLASIMIKITQKHDAKAGLVEASRVQSRSIVLDIINKDPKAIAQMNFELAEAVCMEPILDGCDLIGRFSPKRDLNIGVSYVNTKH